MIDDRTLKQADRIAGHDPIAEAERANLMATICPDCGGRKWRGENLCSGCWQEQAEKVEPPDWLGVLMLVLIALIIGAVAIVINVQIVKARGAQTEQVR
jgi:hypothetical protein